MINKQGKFRGNETNARRNLGRKVCDFGSFLWLLEQLFDESIDVDTRRVEEVNAVMFLRAQE